MWIRLIGWEEEDIGPGSDTRTIQIEASEVSKKHNGWFFTFIEVMKQNIPENAIIQFYKVNDNEQIGYFEKKGYFKGKCDAPHRDYNYFYLNGNDHVAEALLKNNN